MKFLAIFAILAVVNAGPTPRNLQNDLEDFMALLPLKEIEETFYDYLAEDEEFQEILDYFTSDEFIALLKKIEDMPEIREALKFFDDLGIDAYEIINKINDFLNIERIDRSTLRLGNSKKPGLRGFLDYIESLIPYKKLYKLYERKLKESKDFQALINKMKSPEAQSIVDKLMKDATFKDFLEKAKERGVDVKKVFDVMSYLFGWKFNYSNNLLRSKKENLKDDFKALYNVLPQYEIRKLTYSYLKYDNQFQELAEYVFSEEFYEFISWFNTLPEVQSAYAYLEFRGLKAKKYVKKLYEYLDIENYDPRIETSEELIGGLKGYIEDLNKLVPWDEFWRVSDERKLKSAYYRELLEILQSGKLKEFYKYLETTPEFRNFLKKLYDIVGKEYPED